MPGRSRGGDKAADQQAGPHWGFCAAGTGHCEGHPQEMRTPVCAQCHVEYYFAPVTNRLLFSEGRFETSLQLLRKALGRWLS
ncbi:ammonia-forming cytochrome c nitrite reductase subunit c552 [Desulforudis sp. DRI-14]